jgi:hypothetical protein
MAGPALTAVGDIACLGPNKIFGNSTRTQHGLTLEDCKHQTGVADAAVELRMTPQLTLLQLWVVVLDHCRAQRGNENTMTQSVKSCAFADLRNMQCCKLPS